MTVVTVTLNPCIDKTVSVERVVPDRKLSGFAVGTYPGGGGINVARVVCRLGPAVRAHWSCGGDTGRRLAQLLDEESVPHEPVPIEDSVRENVIIHDDSTGEQYRVGMPGPTLRDEERRRWVEQIRRIPSTVRYVVFSGSSPEGASPEWCEELVRAVPDDIRVVVDTKKEALRRALEVGIHLIKPNVHELEELVRREMSDDAAIEQAAREIVARGGAEVVIVSLGRGGALLATRDGLERLSAPSVPLRSKVGAGDSMVGGVVAGLARGKPLPEAVRLGVAAGAAAVMTEGTELCRKEDAERLQASVRWQELTA